MIHQQSYLFFAAAVIACVLVGSTDAHMMMSEPPPRQSVNNPGPGGNIDYSYTAPLGVYPCKGYPQQAPVRTYKAGSNINVAVSGGAAHNGGHCQFALSYDDTKFVVLSTVIRNCLVGGSSPFGFNVPLPSSAPPGRATLAWAWINASGNREYYMNCADITIENSGKSAPIAGPQLLVANLDAVNNVKFPEFGSAGNPDNHELFDQRPTITIGSAGGSSAGSNDGSNQSAPTPASLPASAPAATPAASVQTPSAKQPQAPQQQPSNDSSADDSEEAPEDQ